MSDKKRKKVDPLLYLYQPKTVQKPKPIMQERFNSRLDKKKEVVEKEPITNGQQESNKKSKKPKAKHELELGALSNDLNFTPLNKEENEIKDKAEGKETRTDEMENLNPVRQVSTSGLKKVKPFKEKTIEEKTEYLAHYIMGRPPFPCEFVTDERKYKGVLLTNNKHDIEIKTFQEENIVLKKNSIKAITIIGLH